jgi:hypothetical protein
MDGMRRIVVLTLVLLAALANVVAAESFAGTVVDVMCRG